MRQRLRILHLEDDPADVELVRAMIEREGFALELVSVAAQADFQAQIEEQSFDLIISDFTLPSYNGMVALTTARTLRPELPFIFFSGTIGEESAVESLRNGATDYVLKQRPEKLLPAIRRALRELDDRQSRAEAEKTLEEREKWYRALAENSLDFVSVIDAASRFKYASASIERTLGYAPDELLGTEALQLIHPADFATAQSALQRAIDHPDQRILAELRARHKNGEFRTLDIIGQSFLHVPEIGGIVVNSRDITERQLAQQRIQEQAIFLDEAQDAICATDLDRRIVFWNQGAERLYGWSPAEAIGRKADEFLFDSARSLVQEWHATLLEAGAWEREMTQATKQGAKIIVNSRWKLLRDDAGSPKSFLAVNTDVTEKKKAEDQFLRAQRMECIGSLAGGIAHDLNNILAPVIMGSDLLREYVTAEEGKQMLELIRSSGERGSDMVKQILSFARGTSGAPAVIELKHLIHEISRLLRETFPRSIEIRTRIASPLHPISGNATQLHQMLMNLCVNARDAMPQGGVLHLEARNVWLDQKQTSMKSQPVSGAFVVLIVTDTGSGIAPAFIRQIFEPFFTTKSEGLGTGLGLPTVLSLVKGHGGFIEVFSREGRGTSFHIFLPAAEATDTELAPIERLASPAGHGEVLLLVDDEAAILELMRGALENNGYQVLSARDGAQGLNLYRQFPERIDLVITDLMMPIMDGAAMAKCLRNINPSVKVILASGVESRSKLDDSDPNIAQAILHKPYTTQALFQTVATVLAGQ